MEGEAGVLQQRIESAAVGGRRHEARERVRGEQHETQEAGGNGALDGEHARPEPRRQVAAEAGDRGAEQRQDQRPQQHGTLVVPPDAADLVEQRLGRVGVAGDVLHREVGTDVGPGQRRECARHGGELDRGRGPRQRHPRAAAARRAGHRQRALEGGDDERDDEREVAGFDGHSPSSEPGAPAAARASATSGGM